MTKRNIVHIEIPAADSEQPGSLTRNVWLEDRDRSENELYHVGTR